MSSRVRRMALGLATLTLLASLFTVVQGFMSAPEALASCPARFWCDPPYFVPLGGCCCWEQRYYAYVWRYCYWQEWDCTINSDLYLFDAGCYGMPCDC